MAMKKKVKMSKGKSFEEIKMIGDADYMTSDEMKPADGYQAPADLQKSAQDLQMSGLSFSSEVEMQDFLKMGPEERASFAAMKEKKRRKVRPGSTEIERQKMMMSQGL